jgi:hypothetical protein
VRKGARRARAGRGAPAPRLGTRSCPLRQMQNCALHRHQAVASACGVPQRVILHTYSAAFLILKSVSGSRSRGSDLRLTSVFR